MLTKQPNDEINNPCEMLEKYSNDKRQERLKYCKEHLKTMVRRLARRKILCKRFSTKSRISHYQCA